VDVAADSPQSSTRSTDPALPQAVVRVVADRGHQALVDARFVTRAKTLFYARLAFLTLGLGVLAVRAWSDVFGIRSGVAFLIALAVYFGMLLYSVANFLVVERPRVGKVVTFVTLCFDLVVIVYLITASGGLGSPLLASQLMFTTLFVILFPKPLALLPPLLCLPIIARIDQILGGRAWVPADLFTVLWYSAINLILIYAIVYLNQREDAQQVELLALQKNLQQMAVVDERNRLAREIHDGLGATLSSLIIQAEYLETLAGSDRGLRQEIRELKGAAEESIDELRRSLKMMKEDFDLVPAVEDHCRTFGDRAKVEVDFQREGKERQMSSESALTIFRTLQESLSNATKHGNASRVVIRLAFEVDRLALSVRDNGSGFDTRTEKPGHYGLINMRERARKVGGTVYIESEPGRGTHIALEIPYATGQTGTWRISDINKGVT
jgi:signal transduction histidine kinase